MQPDKQAKQTWSFKKETKKHILNNMDIDLTAEKNNGLYSLHF